MVWRAAFAKFISGSISRAYKMRFGREAAVSRDTYTGKHGGPFVRFARAILSADAAGANISDKAIEASLRRNTPHAARKKSAV